MVRRGSGLVAEKILNVLSSNPHQKRTIQEISKESEVSWDSTKRYLDLFVNLKIVRVFPEDNKYQKMRSLENDILFSIPLSEEHKSIIKKIYGAIKNIWKDIYNDKPLTKTLVQKIAVDVVEEKYPDIPRGWYLYGEILLLPFEADNNYEDGLENKEDVTYIQEICTEYSSCDKSYQIRKHQYEKKKKELYLVKEKLYNQLAFLDYKENTNKNKIRESLNNFIFKIGRKEFNADILAIVEDFCGTVLGMFRHLDADKLDVTKPVVLETFSSIWQLVATYELYDSLTKFYDKQLLQDYLFEKIKVLKENAIESLEELYEQEPKYVIPDDEIGKKLKSLMGSAKELTPEEQKEREIELKKKEKELGHEKFQEWLLEQAGLK